MKTISYKHEFVDLVSQLTPFNDKIVIEFDEEADVTKIRRQDDEKTAAYILSAPREYFDIDNKVGFYKYTEFYRFLKTLNNPTIKINQNKLMLSNDASKFTYILTDASRMKTGPNDFNMEDPDFKFDLDSDSLMEIVKMSTLLKNSKHSEITCLDNKINIKICMEAGDNSFEKTFDVTFTSKEFSKEPLQFKIFSDFFTKLPARHNYTISIKAPGHLIFEMKSDDIQLKLYTALLRNRKRKG